MCNEPFVVVLELSWYESHRVGPRPRQLWSQHFEPALRNLDNLRKRTKLNACQKFLGFIAITANDIPNFSSVLPVFAGWTYMCLEVKVSSPLFHTLPVEVTIELCSFFCCLLNVLWNLAGLHLLRVLLLQRL